MEAVYGHQRGEVALVAGDRGAVDEGRAGTEDRADGQTRGGRPSGARPRHADPFHGQVDGGCEERPRRERTRDAPGERPPRPAERALESHPTSRPALWTPNPPGC